MIRLLPAWLTVADLRATAVDALIVAASITGGLSATVLAAHVAAISPLAAGLLVWLGAFAAGVAVARRWDARG